MRYVVAREGVIMPNLRKVEKGALKPAEDALSVFVRHRLEAYPETLVGTATDFERDEQTNELSFEITALRDVDLSNMDAQIFVTGFVYRLETNIFVITQGVIRAVYFTPIEG